MTLAGFSRANMHTLTIISGREQSRCDFDPSYGGVLSARQSALIMDVALLSSAIQDKRQRLVIVVSCAEELNTAFSQAEKNEFWKSENIENDWRNPQRILITGYVPAELDRVNIRLTAIRRYHCGIAVTTQKWNEEMGLGKSRGRVRHLVDRILNAWDVGQTEEIEKIWGDPCWAPGEDMIIPPEWDSKGKIIAVTDAAGIKLDENEQATSVVSNIEGTGTEQTLSSDRELDKNEQYTSAASSSEAAGTFQQTSEVDDSGFSSLQEWLARHRQWLSQMEQPLSQDSEGETSSDESPDDDSTESNNFFKRLLSSTKSSTR